MKRRSPSCKKVMSRHRRLRLLHHRKQIRWKLRLLILSIQPPRQRQRHLIRWRHHHHLMWFQWSVAHRAMGLAMLPMVARTQVSVKARSGAW